MCLYDKKRFRFTFKRIPVYKIVRYYNNDYKKNRVFLTPYECAIVKKQMSGFDSFTSAVKRFIKNLKDYKFLKYYYRNFLFKLKIIFCGDKLPTFNEYSFGEGFIHAYRDETTAKTNIDNLRHNVAYLTIIEGYIPAFTRYQIENNDICARRMIFPNI